MALEWWGGLIRVGCGSALIELGFDDDGQGRFGFEWIKGVLVH